jgi:hypothetical protein
VGCGDADLPQKLRDAPIDDEPMTYEEEVAIARAREQMARGETMTTESLVERLKPYLEQTFDVGGIDEEPMTALVPVTAGPWTKLSHEMRFRSWSCIWSLGTYAAMVDKSPTTFVWVVRTPDGREIARDEAPSLEAACQAADVALRAYCKGTKYEAAR